MSWYSEITEWAKSLEPKWQLAAVKGEAFSDFAFREMQGHSFHKNFNLQNDLKDILESKNYPEQIHPNSTFGDPPITLYLSPDKSFYLDLYIWTKTQTSIHQHAFEGAFSVLQGHSLESNYEFIQTSTIGTSFWGQLKNQEMLQLKPGDTHSIFFKDKMIHQVLHISKPTVSLVLRTYVRSNSQIQYNYNFKRLASNGHPPGDVVGKLRALTWYLQNENIPTFKMVESLLPYAELWSLLASHPQAFNLLKKLAFLYADQGLLDEIIEQILFLSIFQALDTEENKILFAALEFYGSEWTTWIEKNYQLTPEDCRKKLSEAIKSISWVEDKILMSPLLQELFKPGLATETI